MRNSIARYDRNGKFIIENYEDLRKIISDVIAESNKYSLDLEFRRNFTITPAYDIAQVETATAAGTVTTAGNAIVTVTSALFEDDEVIDVPVELDDTANDIALAIRTALTANTVVSEHFTVSGETDKIILTAKVPAVNDTTLNIAIDNGVNGACEGITESATSTNTTAGGIKQVETATAAGTVTTAGRAKCTLTADGMAGSPLHVPFDVELDDGAEEIAAALRLALANHAIVDITEYFDISGEGASVVLTKKETATNDETLNILISDGEGEGASVGVTTAETSVNTTAGRADTEQVETVTAIGTITKAGYALITITSALFTEDEEINVDLELSDDASAIATAIRSALTANAIVSADFTISGEGADVILTAKVAAANDETLNISIQNGISTDSEGITTATSSANTTAGAIAAKTIEFLNNPSILGELTEIKIYIDVTTISPAITYPESVVWDEDTEPTLTVGSCYELAFYTIDGGTKWRGKLAGTYSA